jgi:hypothetical protein
VVAHVLLHDSVLATLTILLPIIPVSFLVSVLGLCSYLPLSLCSHYNSNSTATLLILGVVRRVDRTHEQLDEPHLRGKIDTALSRHFSLFKLKVGCAIDKTTDLGVVVEFFEESSGFLVVSYLCEFWISVTGP